MSRARQLADLLDSGGDVHVTHLDNTSEYVKPSSEPITYISGLQGALDNTAATDIHAFKAGSDNDLIWEHGDNLTLQDGNNQDSYLSVITGSTDQSYSVDSNGNLICTF